MKVDFVTGIQRVVREITVRMLNDKSIDLVLMVYSFQKDAFQILDNQKFADYFTKNEGEKENILTTQCINYDEIPSGAVFFDIDSVWNSRLKRSYLFPILKQKGVKIVTQLYDLIPITHPQFCHENTVMNFMLYVGANLKYADLIITSADATTQALNDLTDRLGLDRKKSIVVPLGCDFTKKENVSPQDDVDPEVKKIATGKYILMVGTIEPRKNHSLVIDALESGLAQMGVKAIFAGRIGWNVAELENRMKNHELYNKNLFFVERPNDATVDYLYKNAFVVAFPTFNEGFGLPMIEAFERQTPVVASDIGVLHEVAKDFADYFNPNDKNDLVKCIKNLVENPEEYNKKKEHLKDFVPFTWDSSAKDMLSAVVSVDDNIVQVSNDVSVKQMVVLTARNDDILATLPYIDKFMPFIKEMVVCCPDKNVEELKSKYNGRLQLKFLTDSEVLAGNPLPQDHAMRNFFLRCLILKNPIIDDVFLMTDDDYRPLRELSINHFIKNNRYLSYYCYDLQSWKGTYGNPTSFDESMARTKDFLLENGYPTMMYSSHQTQIIDKKIFNEMTSKFPDISNNGLCDWSTYFNYGVGTYPDMFEPVPYVSMGWPGARSDWDLYVQPTDFLFENHYSVLYEKGKVFEGFTENYHDNIQADNIQKVMLYSKELQKQMEGREVYNSYCESYWLQYREMPSFVIFLGVDDNLAIHTPTYLQLKNTTWNRIPFTFDKSIVEKLGSKDILLSYWFTSESGENLMPVANIKIDINDLSFHLPIKTPPFKERGIFNVRVILQDKNISQSISIKANII